MTWRLSTAALVLVGLTPMGLGTRADAEPGAPEKVAHVATSAALAALSSADFQVVVRDGHDGAGDGPSVTYVGRSTPCDFGNGVGDGGAEVRSADGGCWVGVFAGQADVRAWGAKCNASTDDTAAVAAAERFLESRQGGTLLIPGQCVAAIRVTGDNLRIMGAGPLSDGAGGSVLIAPTLTAPAISVGHVSGFTLQNIKITSRAQQTAGALVLLDATVDANLYNLQIRHAYDGVVSENATLLRIAGGSVRDFSHRAWYATGDNVVRAGGGNDYYFTQWVVDEDDNTYAPRAGFETDQNGGSITFGDGVDIIHAHNGLLVDPGPGQFVDWIYFGNGAYIDSCDYGRGGAAYYNGGIGIDFAPTGGGIINGGSFANGWSSTCTKNIAIQPDARSTASGVKFASFESLNAGQVGLYLRNATNVQFGASSLIAGSSKANIGAYPQIEVDGATSVNFNGVIAGDAEGYGATAKFGLQVDATFTGSINAVGLDGRGNATAAWYNGAADTNITITQSPGINPVGAASVRPAASPWTYTAGVSPETLMIYGGSIDTVTLGGATICTTVPCQVPLAPHQSVRTTYPGAAPSVITNRQ